MKKRLHRSKKYRIIGGVAGGIAEYFDLDPVIVRVLFIITILFHGISILAYFILWLIVPEEKHQTIVVEEPDKIFPEDDARLRHNISENKRKRNLFFGVGLIGVGAFFLLDNFFFWWDFDIVGPMILVMIGAYILLKKRSPETAQEVK